MAIIKGMAAPRVNWRTRVLERAIPAVASRRRAFPARLLARAARLYLAGYDNFNYSLETNGELRVLEALRSVRPTCVFDVGANTGAWTEVALSTLPGATIHCFEIVEDTARVLAARLGGMPRVVVNRHGLSDEEGHVDVRYYPGFSEVSSVDGLSHTAHGNRAGALCRPATVTARNGESKPSIC